MNKIKVPTPRKFPKELKAHGDIRIDDYYWLNERENPEVIAHLNEEKRYFEALTQHTVAARETLFLEMKGRIKEDDSTVPYKENGYWYLVRYLKGKEYPLYLRRKGSLDAGDQVLFDANEMAIGHEYFSLGGIAISPNNQLAIFGVDTVSRRQYTLKVKNLSTGELFKDEITDTTGGGVWANDNKTFFYTKNDPQTLRSYKIYRHTLGTPSSEDEEVYHEEDEAFSTFVYRTKSKKFIVIGAMSTVSSEFRYIRSDNPTAPFTVFTPRERGLEYDIAHYGDSFYILTNKDGATNFKLMVAKEGKTHTSEWREFIAHRPDVRLEDIDIFKAHYVLSERQNGLHRIRIVRWDGTADYHLPFESETFTAYVGNNPDFNTTSLRYVYNSLTTPSSVIDFDMDTQTKTIMKEQEVLGGNFDKRNYQEQRLWAPAPDGKQIPISLVYHKDTPLAPETPLLQYAYGSYGHTIDPYFSTVRLSLLDRGFAFAIAHVRGGEYLGRSWYESGKLLQKQNTFTDFIACSEYLLERNMTSPKHLYCAGGSAGGLLIGAVINKAPQLYNGAIAAVPFVDVVTTMLDDSIPLTTGEYDEWGNPNDKEFYEYMKSYSPYDNVKAQAYPNLLVITGLHDSQVQYFEPAKWVAKLRDVKTDSRPVLFDINMDAGHGGASGRFEALREKAKEYLFLLDLEGRLP